MEELNIHRNRKLTRNILIVDDDTSSEDSWQTILQSFGENIRIDWATNETEASGLLAVLAKLGLFYDLVIADIFLSGSGTGLDLWKKATLIQRERFIMVSAVEPGMISEYFRSQFDLPKFLRKPFDLGEVMDLVGDILKMVSVGDVPINGNTLLDRDI